MIDLEQLRRRADHVLTRWQGEARAASNSAWRARVITAAAMLVSIGVYALMWDVPAWLKTLTFVSAAAIFWGRSHSLVFAVLILSFSAGLVLDVVLLERLVFAQDQMRLEDWVGTTALLAFAMFAFRLVELPRGAEPGSPPWLRLTRSAENRKRGPHVLLAPFSGAALRLAAAPAFAMLLLWLTPWTRFAGNELRLFPPFFRAIAFFWAIGLIGLAAATAFSVSRWRRLSPRQGSIHARWVILDESRREQAAVEKARARRLRRRPSGERT
jgi:hypothetical protein